MLYIVSVFLNLLRYFLWYKMWSILVNVFCVLEKNVNAVWRRNTLYVSINPIVQICQLTPMSSYWFFWLDDLFIDVSRVLKTPIIIILLYISYYLDYILKFSYVRCINIYRHYIHKDWLLYHYIMPFFVFCYNLCYKSVSSNELNQKKNLIKKKSLQKEH